MDTRGGCQATPGTLFVHNGNPGWNADPSKSYPSSADQGGSTSCHKPCMGSSQRCIHPRYAIKHGRGYRNTGGRTTTRHPAARYRTSRPTCQKEPMGSTSTRAPYWNCLDTFKPDISIRQREQLNDFIVNSSFRFLIFFITVLRRGDVTRRVIVFGLDTLTLNVLFRSLNGQFARCFCFPKPWHTSLLE